MRIERAIVAVSHVEEHGATLRGDSRGVFESGGADREHPHYYDGPGLVD
jgi:hypothetical protein